MKKRGTDSFIFGLPVVLDNQSGRNNSLATELESMALVTVSAQSEGREIFGQADFAQSDDEFEQQLQEAVEVSNDQFALQLQHAEVLELSTFAYAYALQVSEILAETPSDGLGLLQLTASASASASASAGSSSVSFSPLPEDEEEGEEYFKFQDNRLNLPMFYSVEDGHGQGFSARRETGKKIIMDSGFSLLKKDCSTISRSVPVKLCGICFEDSADMFEGNLCLHRFCEACMTRYIHSMLEQRRHQIYCPHDSCGEALTLDECRYFLPAEIFEQWSAVMVEAEIPEALKVYCPFPDCSGLLVKENAGALDVVDVEMAECPFCNRLFCARCNVPWHANLQCSEFQSLPSTDRTEADFLLLKLADDRNWRRCGKCKSMVELIYGCNHITCRCRHEFCYVCGISWKNGSPDCNCPRTTVDRLIQ